MNKKKMSLALVLSMAVGGASPFMGCAKPGANVQKSALTKGSVNLSVQGTQAGALSAAGRISLLDSLFSPTARSSSLVSPTTSQIVVKNAAGVTVGTITLSDARLALKEIKLKLAQEEMDGEADDEDGDGETEEESDDDIAEMLEDSERVKYEGPYVVDLLTNASTPSLGEIEMIAGVYKEIEMKLDKIEGDEDDGAGASLIDPTDPLYGNSIYLSGTYTGDTAAGPGTATDVPFVLSFDFDETFELTGATDTSEGFTVSDSASNPVVIAFRMPKWFNFGSEDALEEGIDFSQVTIGADGKITLDERAQETSVANDSIRDVIKENIKESADYGKDSDGDGELGSEEDDDPAEEDSEDE